MEIATTQSSFSSLVIPLATLRSLVTPEMNSVILSAASAVKTGLIGGGGGNDSVIAVGRSGEDLSIRGGDGGDSIDVIFSAGTKTTVIEVTAPLRN